jgi:hypothetical protein
MTLRRHIDGGQRLGRDQIFSEGVQMRAAATSVRSCGFGRFAA